jgi:hypothetical protein
MASGKRRLRLLAAKLRWVPRLSHEDSMRSWENLLPFSASLHEATRWDATLACLGPGTSCRAFMNRPVGTKKRPVADAHRRLLLSIGEAAVLSRLPRQTRSFFVFGLEAS